MTEQSPSIRQLEGAEEIHVECAVHRHEPEFCDGWSSDVELDSPAYIEGDRIFFPGFGWVCGSCGQPHEFVIDGVEVSNLV